jgi:TonB family protein
MMPVKDTLEKLIPTVSPSTPQTPGASKPESGGLRSDAVSLEVLVKVHGSRVTEVVRDVTPHTEPFEEQTSTMIVFPQGGVLKMSTAVNVGQMLVVTNLKSGQDAICRVVKVRAYGATQSYVEVEFTHRQVGYWGVQFPSDVVEAPKKPAPVPVPRAPIAPSAAFEAPAPHPQPAPPINPVNATPVPARPVDAAKVPSPFVGLGAQEDVQLSATPTKAARSVSAAPAPPVDLDFKPRVVEAPKQAQVILPLPAPSVDELRGDAQPAAPEPVDTEEPVLVFEDSPAVESSLPATPAPAFRAFGTSTNLGGIANPAGTRPLAREIFGAPSESEKAAPQGEDSRNLILSAVAVVLLAVVGAGGYFYLHHHNATPTAEIAPPASQPEIAPSPAPSIASPVGVNSTKPAPARSATVAASSPAAPVREGTAADTKQPARNEASAPAASPVVSPATPTVASAGAEQHHASGNVPSLFGALNAHPVASHSSAEEGEAPAVPVGQAESLPAISQPAAGLPAPAPPVSTNKPPRLISSVLPVYPDFARQRGIEGNVVIQATIEANGAVGATKIISGPQSLRESALHALRQWKYEPGKVDGQNAAADVTVTLHFSGK